MVLLLTAASLCAQQIPPGTLLPAMLDTTLDSSHSKPGQQISAKLMQDVPLPNGGKIKRESKLMGHVVAVSPESSGHGASISLQFNQIDIDKHVVPINLGLRALASMELVGAARQPANADSGIGTTGWDANMSQIGGQIAFNGQRIVKAPNGQVVGKVVQPGAVLGIPLPNPDRGCLGAIGNPSEQAFWVFSTDACGLYDEKNLQLDSGIGGASPGSIVLQSPTKFTIRSGSGLLLQAN